MAFPPPTNGFVESPIGETLEDYLTPNKSAIHTMAATDDLNIKDIQKGYDFDWCGSGTNKGSAAVICFRIGKEALFMTLPFNLYACR
jgi:hypothetical protein